LEEERERVFRMGGLELVEDMPARHGIPTLDESKSAHLSDSHLDLRPAMPPVDWIFTQKANRRRHRPSCSARHGSTPHWSRFPLEYLAAGLYAPRGGLRTTL
jgi:hypothetical protein